MLKVIRNGLLVMVCLTSSACVTKAYQGTELPDEQLATVSLKTPTAALIPIFWLPFLNMLTWLDSDWHETTWGSFKVNNIEINRFTTLAITPGKFRVTADTTKIISQEQIGVESCNYGSCVCTNSDDSNQNDKSRNKNKVCERSVTCTINLKVSAQDNHCVLAVNADSGKSYEVFLRDNILMLEDTKSQQLTQGTCELGPIYKYDTTESTSRTEACAC